MKTAETEQTTETQSNTPTLDALTRRHTAFRSFAHLVAGGTSETGEPMETAFFPNLAPGRDSSEVERAELAALADAYDEVQAKRGDARRAARGARRPRWARA